MSDVTRLLARWNAGDAAAMPELLAAVYDELRQVADRVMRLERQEHSLQPTALVNEVYVKFAGLRDLKLENRRHFYGAAAEAMRDQLTPLQALALLSELRKRLSR